MVVLLVGLLQLREMKATSVPEGRERESIIIRTSLSGFLERCGCPTRSLALQVC
jgi:hypothetical protein